MDHLPSGALGATRLVGGARSTSAAFELTGQVRRIAFDLAGLNKLPTGAPAKVLESPVIFICRYGISNGN
jgi:hypothetical protein